MNMDKKEMIKEALHDFDAYVEATIGMYTNSSFYIPCKSDSSHAYDWTIGFIKGLRVAREYFKLYFKEVIEEEQK